VLSGLVTTRLPYTVYADKFVKKHNSIDVFDDSINISQNKLSYRITRPHPMLLFSSQNNVPSIIDRRAHQ
jgi:hypothetical protein